MSDRTQADGSICQENKNIEHKYKRKKQESINADGYEEITIAVIGSVDSGKSSTIGVLSNEGLLDDGNGLARSLVMTHPHEINTGRTSDISYRYYRDEAANPKRINTLIDLAGHKAYLRTTISGMASAYPDFAIVCISDKITDMTLEHMRLAVNLEIPILVVFTKVDLIPTGKTKQLIKTLSKKASNSRYKLYEIRNNKDLVIINSNNRIIPFVKISNKSGYNVDLLRSIIRKYNKRQKQLSRGFVIDHLYPAVPGHGPIISGIAGCDIKKNDILYIAPDFVQVKVKSIHNDYRYEVQSLSFGMRGCLCLKINSKHRRYLQKGNILLLSPPNKICNRFNAIIKIPPHHTSIRDGYQATVNCGAIRTLAQFENIKPLDKRGNEIKSNKPVTLRSGQHALVSIIMRKPYYIEIGQQVIFRDGSVKCFGKIININ